MIGLDASNLAFSPRFFAEQLSIYSIHTEIMGLYTAALLHPPSPLSVGHVKRLSQKILHSLNFLLVMVALFKKRPYVDNIFWFTSSSIEIFKFRQPAGLVLNASVDQGGLAPTAVRGVSAFPGYNMLICLPAYDICIFGIGLSWIEIVHRAFIGQSLLVLIGPIHKGEYVY